MELMVVGALGIVIYCGYLTAKDLVVDLKQEGILPGSLSCRGLWKKWKLSVPECFDAAGLVQRVSIPNQSFMLVPCRSDFSRVRQHHQANRLYRPEL
jgi:hypothetical protein